MKSTAVATSLLLIVIFTEAHSATRFYAEAEGRPVCESSSFQSATQAKPFSVATLDFSGIDRFWEVYEALKEDREPTLEQWDSLFSTPGYAALEERERRRKTLSEAFRLAFMPSKQEQADAAINKGGWVGHVLPHLRRVPAARKDLTNFQVKLRSGDWLVRATRRAQRLLTPRLTQRHPPPPVSFIFFAPDGRGYPKIVVADLLRIMAHPDMDGFFAHELFHFYRRHAAKAYQEPTEGDVPLMQLLTNIEEEGIADQLDKADIPFLSEKKLKRLFPNPASRSFYEDYRRHYAESNAWLLRIDRTLAEISQEPTGSKEKVRLLQQQLPIGGRPLGAFMARTIIRELGERQIVGVVGDPLGFWQLYNKAARPSKGKSQVLSAKAMAVIERLHRTYAIVSANTDRAHMPIIYER